MVAEEVKRPFFITYIIAAINVLVFIAMFLVDSRGGLLVQIMFGSKINALIADGQLFRFLTPVFLHAGIAHLAFNTIALISFGVETEYIFGKKRFLIIYFVSGIVASMASFLFNENISLGASGAIFGLLGANLFLYFQNPNAYKMVYRSNILIILGINLVYGFMTPSIDNFAHLGGLVGGFLTSFAFLNADIRPKLRLLKVIAPVILAVFALYTITVGIPQYKASESYYYFKSIILISTDKEEEGVRLLIQGKEKFGSARINNLISVIKQEGIIK